MFIYIYIYTHAYTSHLGVLVLFIPNILTINVAIEWILTNISIVLGYYDNYTSNMPPRHQLFY